MRFLYKGKLKNYIYLFNKSICYCKYYCYLFIIVSEFYWQEQHSDETRSVCPLKGIFQVTDPSESMYRKIM